jgi:ribosomal protein S18 acetylase RimI-like enzyme
VGGVIRRCTSADHEWIRETAAQVYRDLGDYGTIIPSWLDHPGVLCFVEQADEGSEPRGFILVGFYDPNGGDAAPEDEVCIADLLAIAVAPAHQRRGVGSEMLLYAIDVARAARADRRVSELRLTVADGNAGARALFDRNGFTVVDETYGSYDGGQRAIRMRLPL